MTTNTHTTKHLYSSYSKGVKVIVTDKASEYNATLPDSKHALTPHSVGRVLFRSFTNSFTSVWFGDHDRLVPNYLLVPFDEKYKNQPRLLSYDKFNDGAAVELTVAGALDLKIRMARADAECEEVTKKCGLKPLKPLTLPVAGMVGRVERHCHEKVVAVVFQIGNEAIECGISPKHLKAV